MRVTARDLKHDADPVRFGTAILRCEGYAPDCSSLGRCCHDGDCFASPPNLVAARMIEQLIPTGAAGVHLAYLRQCASMLRDGKVFL